MDNDQTNAYLLSRARVMRRQDAGLRFACGSMGHPLLVKKGGARRLLRWDGEKFPIPAVPMTVGVSRRTTTNVTEFAAAAKSDNTIYWYLPETISPAGIPTCGNPDDAQCVVWGVGAHAGLVPNMPIEPRGRIVAGPKLEVTWSYNPLGEQDAPESFEVYAGETAIDWVTPIGSVDYDEQRRVYYFTSGVLAWSSVRFNVRAVSASGVYSLTPKLGHMQLGGEADYLPEAQAGALHVISVTPPTAPAAPRIE